MGSGVCMSLLMDVAYEDTNPIPTDVGGASWKEEETNKKRHW